MTYFGHLRKSNEPSYPIYVFLEGGLVWVPWVPRVHCNLKLFSRITYDTRQILPSFCHIPEPPQRDFKHN